MKPYCDLHTHTTRSDGQKTPRELIALAREAGIRALAITDHNCLVPELETLRLENPDMELIRGCEVSCLYTTGDGREVEIHIPALDFDPRDEAMARVLRANNPDRSIYVNRILEKLRGLGIDLGTYEQLRQEVQGSAYVGRMAIAAKMVREGYAASVDEVFDLYVGGAPGQRRLAYVPNPLRYVTMEEAVTAIERTGIAVLGHLWYYNLSPEESERLVARFKALGGTAMEVDYRRYSREQRAALGELAERYGLLPSAASDYHGQNETDSLDNRFPAAIWERLKESKAPRGHGQEGRK